MIETKHYRCSDTLRDGTVIVIRAVRPDDKDRFLKAFQNLESQSVYTRFFRFKNTLTDEELRAATEVDFDGTVALVVTVPSAEGDEVIIGGGRYVICSPPGAPCSAEVAFTVEEDYQGRGIASRIFRHLLGIARDKGVLHFEADVLPENRAMLAVFSRCGLPMTKAMEEGSIHLALSLADPG